MKVSSYYVHGIKEGRKLLQWWQQNNEDVPTLIRSSIESLERLLQKTHPTNREEREHFQGELDFWRNQEKIRKE